MGPTQHSLLLQPHQTLRGKKPLSLPTPHSPAAGSYEPETIPVVSIPVISESTEFWSTQRWVLAHFPSCLPSATPTTHQAYMRHRTVPTVPRL